MDRIINSNVNNNDLFYAYNYNLYGLNSVLKFTNDKSRFEGEILSVDSKGSIRIRNNDNSIDNYNIHEIKMIY